MLSGLLPSVPALIHSNSLFSIFKQSSNPFHHVHPILLHTTPWSRQDAGPRATHKLDGAAGVSHLCPASRSCNNRGSTQRALKELLVKWFSLRWTYVFSTNSSKLQLLDCVEPSHFHRSIWKFDGVRCRIDVAILGVGQDFKISNRSTTSPRLQGVKMPGLAEDFARDLKRAITASFQPQMRREKFQLGSRSVPQWCLLEPSLSAHLRRPWPKLKDLKVTRWRSMKTPKIRTGLNEMNAIL